jgi:hypothetical protein
MRIRLAALAVVVLLVAGTIAVAGAGSPSAAPSPAPSSGPALAAAAGDPAGTLTVVDGSTTFSFPVTVFDTAASNTMDITSSGSVGKAVLDPLVVTKRFDKHSPTLERYTLTGKFLTRVTLALSTGGRYVLTDAVVSRIETKAPAGKPPVDRVWFEARQRRVVKGGTSSCFNVQTNTGC